MSELEKTIKICKYLDGNQEGGVICINDNLAACYPCSAVCRTKIADYRNINLTEFVEKRKKFVEDLNANKTNLCDDCVFLEIRNENEIDLDKFSILNVASYTTCNLRCKYCYFTDEQLGAKLTPESRKLLPIVKNMAEQGYFTDKILLAIAGGEPLLFDDIPETLEYLSSKYSAPAFNLQSNSTLSNRIDGIINALKNFKCGWTNLYTSVDAGTRETYKSIRGRDLFENLKQNLYKYAKASVFTTMQLKYILLNEDGMYNLDLKDLYGFLRIATKVGFLNSRATDIVIDRNLYQKKIRLSKEIVDAAVILVYFAKKVNLNIRYSPCAFIEPVDIDLIEKLAKEYPKKKKGFKELYAYILFNLYITGFCLLKKIKKVVRLIRKMKIFAIIN